MLDASRTVAVSVSAAPVMSVALAGLTVTVATGAGGGAFTVICAVALCPSLAAVMVAVPAALAVTVTLAPFAWMDAICGALDSQLTERPFSSFPSWSRTVAETDTEPPGVRVADVGVTATLATAAGGCGFTVISALPLFPSLVAVIVALPAPIAVTTPSLETVATC